MSAVGSPNEVLTPILLHTTTPAPGEKVMKYLQSMTQEGEEPDNTPPQDTLRDEIMSLRRDIQATEQALTRKIGKAARAAAILYNESRSTGPDERYEIVPFVNGDDPTEELHNLPPIDSRAAIFTLSDDDLEKYYKGYYPGGTHQTAESHREKIMEAIGMRKSF